MAAFGFVGLLFFSVLLLFPSVNIARAMGIGLAIWAILTSIYVFIVNAGSGVGEALFGLGQEVNVKEITAESAFEKGVNSRKSKNFEDAVNHFQDFLFSGFDKSQERTALWIAQIYENDIKDLHTAKYWYRKSIAFSCKEGTCGENIFARESHDALSGIQNLETTLPNSALEGLQQTKNFIENKNYEEAFSRLQKLGKLFPDNAEVNYLFAHYYIRLNNLGMAVEHFSRTLEKNSKHALAAYYLASTRYEIGDLIQAREELNQYIQIAEDDSVESKRIGIARRRLSKIKSELKVQMP